MKWTKLYIGILLISLIGLGAAMYQYNLKRNAFQKRLNHTLSDGLILLKKGEVLVKEYIYDIAKYSSLRICEENSLELQKVVDQQLEEMKANKSITAINYRAFYLNDNYNEINFHTNLDSIQSIVSSELQENIIKTAIRQNQLKTLNHLNSPLGIDAWEHDVFYGFTTSFNSLHFTVGDTLKSKLVYLGYGKQQSTKPERIYQTFVNNKLLQSKDKFSLEYAVTPTKKGRHTYSVVIKDESNQTVANHDHHFFVEPCTTTNHE